LLNIKCNLYRYASATNVAPPLPPSPSPPPPLPPYVDQCHLNGCHKHATCTPNATWHKKLGLGSGYSCACHAGYAGDGVTCADVDECAVPSDPAAVKIHDCHPRATCSNTDGVGRCKFNSVVAS
jgi:hypothetical protein